MASSNPKDLVGRTKPPLHVIPGNVLVEVGIAMAEGAAKYGPHNWRKIPIGAAAYYDAALRHLIAWWEGEDLDPDSGISHVTKAIAGLVVLRDAQLAGTCQDDRPPKSPADWMAEMQAKVKVLRERAGK